MTCPSCACACRPCWPDDARDTAPAEFRRMSARCRYARRAGTGTTDSTGRGTDRPGAARARTVEATTLNGTQSDDDGPDAAEHSDTGHLSDAMGLRRGTNADDDTGQDAHSRTRNSERAPRGRATQTVIVGEPYANAATAYVSPQGSTLRRAATLDATDDTQRNRQDAELDTLDRTRTGRRTRATLAHATRAISDTPEEGPTGRWVRGGRDRWRDARLRSRSRRRLRTGRNKQLPRGNIEAAC